MDLIFDPTTRESRAPDGVPLPPAHEWVFHPNSGAKLPKAVHVNGWYYVRKSFDGKCWHVMNGDGVGLVDRKTRGDAIAECDEFARRSAWSKAMYSADRVGA